MKSALNSTLSRTLNTSFTTLVVLMSMFILGADSLRGLLFALIIGVLVGTYSSVFIATPIMRDTIGKSCKKFVLISEIFFIYRYDKWEYRRYQYLKSFNCTPFEYSTIYDCHSDIGYKQ